MSSSSQIIRPFDRVPTHIKGLDTLLGGGFLKGGIYLVMGAPGSGKTILANQFGFNHVSKGGRALYVSLLSESHSRLFGHLKPMRFFTEERISESFNFVSAYHTLEKDGLDELLRTLAQTVRQYKANLLIIDGIASAEELSRSPVPFKKFVHDLNAVLGVSGCTALLLSSLQGHLSHPEHTMVDGIVSVDMVQSGMRTHREISVTKLRGSNHLHGRHYFRISDEGITVFPRVETYLGRSGENPDDQLRKVSFANQDLDSFFEGGLVSGSATALVGSAGTGKTSLGCQFLAGGGAQDEPCLYFGFYETPRRFSRRAEAINGTLANYLRNGKVEVIWQPPLEHLIDEVAERLLRAVDARGVKRVFLDGVGGLKAGMDLDSDRLRMVLVVLMNELRSRGVTTVFAEELNLFSDEMDLVCDQSAIAENIVYLRSVDTEGTLRRYLTVMKTREGRQAENLREFTITKQGIKLEAAKIGGLLTPQPKAREAGRRRK